MDKKKVLEYINEIETQLKALKLEIEKPPKKGPVKLAIGDEVTILNPGKGQDNTGTIGKINGVTGRATVNTKRGKVSRASKNLKKK